ncbi:MAG: TRAP transporter permease [Proteobacteria bacterium]|nr:TRAP transporter permease [Pseudomonadota bacterium]
MADGTSQRDLGPPEDLARTLEEIDFVGRKTGPGLGVIITIIAATWSLFQLWITSPLPFYFGFGIVSGVPARGIHLAFGLLLCFLLYPVLRRFRNDTLPWYDVVLALVGAAVALYVWFAKVGLGERAGILLDWDVAFLGFDFALPIEVILGGVGIVLLLEAVRRSLGLPLVAVAGVFLFFSVFGQSMPEIISHKGVSVQRLVGYQWLGGESIFGIPLDVSTSFVFLFVLFGALLERAGAGKYFLDLSFAMVGRYRGGPAKAAILASGMTGMISGSSIANVVTTGTFTIPVMRRIGLPAVKAGAIEVAASVNGQIMPPIMGAAAFVIAEFLGISYFDVVVAAFIPAVIAYIALLYISHLEAMKLGLVGLPPAEIPPGWKTFIRGIHFLAPVVLLVYLLMVERLTASLSVFYAILALMVIIVAQRVVVGLRDGTASPAAAAWVGLVDIFSGLVTGARNMINIAIAVAAAGIIVGAVSSTGLSNAMIGVVEALSGGNVIILLALTAVLCLILGLGLPTTANYLVVASIMAGVLVELGAAAGLVLPLIAVHLYVFYFGLMADVTPPVGLASIAASAISRADPIRTGIQAFKYEIRTAILPVVFIFNPELLLIGVTSIWQGMMVFIVSLIAILAFTSVTQGWMIVKLKLYEAALLLVIVVALFRPDFVLNQVYPEFERIEFERFVAGEIFVEPGRKVRFHVVRETDYGDRFKLFVLETPEGEAWGRGGPYGIELAQAEDGRKRVANLDFNGPAEQAGLGFGDFVTEIDVEQLDRPPKEIVYPFGLVLLGFVILLQLARRRRGTAEAAVG